MSPSRAFAALLIAVGIAVTGCAAEAAPSASSPAPESTVAPTPTPTVDAAAVIPFDGDCNAVLPPETVEAVFDGERPPAASTNSLIHVVRRDEPAALARIGGLSCFWDASTPTIAGLEVTVLPVTEVPESVVSAQREYICAYGWCGRGETSAGMWVFVRAAVSYLGLGDVPLEEMPAPRDAVDGAITAVLRHSGEVLRGQPAPAGEGWWTVPSCDQLAPVVTSAAGMTDPQAGFPGDYFPHGTIWDLRVAHGVDAWCPWFESGSLISEVHLQSGVGAPTAEQLAAAHAEVIEVAGADAAYRLVVDEYGGPRSSVILAVAGDNRLYVSGDAAEDVAAAVSRSNGLSRGAESAAVGRDDSGRLRTGVHPCVPTIAADSMRALPRPGAPGP